MLPEGDKLARRKQPPYWWPEVNSLLQLFLAIAVVAMVGYILVQLLHEKVNLEQTQRDLLMILFGIILGCFKDVYGYTYGSSAGSRRQGDVITKSLEDKDKIIAENVVTAAALAAGVSAGSTETVSTTVPKDPGVTETITTVTEEKK